MWVNRSKLLVLNRTMLQNMFCLWNAVNKDLKCLLRWISANKISLTVTKTEVVI